MGRGPPKLTCPGADLLWLTAAKPCGRYAEPLRVLGGGERAHHPSRMPIFERSALNPFQFSDVNFAVFEFAHLDFPFPVLAEQAESNLVRQAGKRHRVVFQRPTSNSIRE